MPPLPTRRKSFNREEIGSCTLYLGDCLEVLPSLPAGCADAVVTDPPYGLSFMGKGWDHGVPGVPFWSAVAHALKPGGYLLAMGGTRTYHRLACAVEDAGFEVRDCLMWVYGTGFPKGKGCLKPAYEPILLCRKPGPKVLPLGVDECRVEYLSDADKDGATPQGRCTSKPSAAIAAEPDAGRDMERIEFSRPPLTGRWPANLAHDGSDEVLEAFAAFGESKSSGNRRAGGRRGSDHTFAQDAYTQSYQRTEWSGPADAGTAARFFYCAKASKSERGEGNTHPTVKPLALMEWLVKLVCPEGGTVLDPFGGSGSTALACVRTGRQCVLVEREPAYFDTARCRLGAALQERA